MSDADLALFKRSLPRLINSREGNELILSTMRSLAEYDVARGEIAQRLQLGEIDQREANSAYAELRDPLSGLRRAMDRIGKDEGTPDPEPLPAPAAPEIGEVRQGYRFIGGNPADPDSWQRIRRK